MPYRCRCDGAGSDPLTLSSYLSPSGGGWCVRVERSCHVSSPANWLGTKSMLMAVKDVIRTERIRTSAPDDHVLLPELDFLKERQRRRPHCPEDCWQKSDVLTGPACQLLCRRTAIAGVPSWFDDLEGRHRNRNL